MNTIMNAMELVNKIGSAGYDMLIELDGIRHLADTIKEDLFGGRNPDLDMYEIDYNRLAALFHMMDDAIYKFEDEFSLLIGEGATEHFERESRSGTRSELMEIDKWWRVPKNITQPSPVAGKFQK